MKRFIYLTAAFLTALITMYPKPAYAQSGGEWGRVLNKTTYLYNSADTLSPCFLIPETYYVKILGQDGSFYLVSYQTQPDSILGYVKAADLYMCDYTPENPYLFYKLDIKSGAKGYLSTDFKNHNYIFNSGNALYYFGKYENDGDLYYYAAAFNGYRYYVSASDCSALSYPLNSDPLPSVEPIKQQPPNDDVLPAPSKMGGKTKMLLILLLIIPALAATVFILKPPQSKQQKKYFYDENEYE